VQPEILRKKVHFLKHLKNWFESPIPQSIVIGLEGFSSNDLDITGVSETLPISFGMISKSRL